MVKSISQLRKEINVLKQKNKLLDDRRKVEEERRKLQKERIELKYGKQKKILRKGLRVLGIMGKETYRVMRNIADYEEPRRRVRKKVKRKKRR